MRKKIEECIEGFCREFLKSPYLCYTEHGLHASFYHRVLNFLGDKEGLVTYKGKAVCKVQKEYPTFKTLGRSKRQHWDIAVIDADKNRLAMAENYDSLYLESAIEFGLNATKMHLEDDIDRLTHKDANVGKPFIVHCCRISSGFSRRDISADSKRNLLGDDVYELLAANSRAIDSGIIIYLAKADDTPGHLWKIDKNGFNEIRIRPAIW